MTGAERTLLLALFRWARAEGGMAYGYLNAWSRLDVPIEQRWGVDFFTDSYAPHLSIWHGRVTAKDYWVADIAEAVDLLAALGIVPLRFSTAYRAGYDACMQAHKIAEQPLPESFWSRGWSDPEVYALLPWADHELAVRR